MIKFYKDEKNIIKDLKADRISITDEMRDFFKSTRKKFGLFMKTIEREIGVPTTTINHIESGKLKTVASNVHKKLMDFYKDEKDIIKDLVEVRIPLTNELREFLKSTREKMGETREAVSDKTGVLRTILSNIEHGISKTIEDSVYNKLLNFYTNEGKSSNKILLTNKMRESLKRERMKSKKAKRIITENTGVSSELLYSIESGITKTISEKFDISQATLLNIESKGTKTISKKLYNSLLEFYGDDRNNTKYYRKGILVLTDKMCGLLRSERKKLGLTLKLVAERFEILPGMLLGIETKTTKSISEELYNKLLDFYANEKVYVKEVKEGRLILSDEMLELLRTGRKKLGMTVKSVSEKFDISKETLQRIESGNAKTISEEIYKRLVEIYNDEKNKPENVSAIRISLTDTMRKSLKSGREKFGMTAESVSKKFDISPMTLRTIEPEFPKIITWSVALLQVARKGLTVSWSPHPHEAFDLIAHSIR